MENKKTESDFFYSFDRNYSAKIHFKKPDKYREIENLSKIENNIISSGSNLSYSPLSFGEGSLSVILRKFNRIINFNKQKKEITVEAGMTLSELLNFTLKHNLWIPQIPGYPSITLGGAVATNAHGKSCATHGTIRNSVKNILIFHKKNGWLNLSDKENKEIYELTLGGLGLTGSIVNITFRLLDLNNKSFTTKKIYVSSIPKCIKLLKSKSSENKSFVYSWNMADSINNLGKGIIFENIPNPAEDEEENIRSINIPNKTFMNFSYFYFSLWNKISIKIVNRIFNYFHLLKKDGNKEDFTKVLFPFCGNESYFYFFGSNGFLESQLLIEENKVEEFFEEFKYLFKLHNPTISLLSFKNMSGSQKFLRFEDNKICITIDYIKNKRNIKFMEEIDKICEKYKILPSIIKDSRLGKSTFENCYNDLENFKKQLYFFDKERIYKSQTSKRLGI